ncbi:MAG: AMP-binding protein [Congregibacter sp.]|nr:AMP-binding protein [Congregibacter sp.]
MNIGKIPAKMARLSPQREALIDPDSGRRLCYGELDERVRRLANGLVSQLGLARGDRVAILSKNCTEYLELAMAATKGF